MPKRDSTIGAINFSQRGEANLVATMEPRLQPRNNVKGEISPARRTYNPSTSAAGDTEAIAAKGRLVLVNGSAPAVLSSLSMNPSELSQTGKLYELARRKGFQIRNNAKRDGKSQRNMTYNENSIALPSDRGALEVSGANLMYEGARVKSWMLGRDVNPAGRGDGSYYAQGAFNLWGLRPVCTPQAPSGFGNSVNNGTKCDTTAGACKCALFEDPLSRCACQVDELCSQCHHMIFQCGGTLPDWPVDPSGRPLTLKEALSYPGFAQMYCAYLRSNCICLELQGSPPCSPYNAWHCCFDFCHGGDMGGGTGPGGMGGGGGFRGGCTSCGGGGFWRGGGSGGNKTCPPGFTFDSSCSVLEQAAICTSLFKAIASMESCCTNLAKFVARNPKDANAPVLHAKLCCNRNSILLDCAQAHSQGDHIIRIYCPKKKGDPFWKVCSNSDTVCLWRYIIGKQSIIICPIEGNFPNGLKLLECLVHELTHSCGSDDNYDANIPNAYDYEKCARLYWEGKI